MSDRIDEIVKFLSDDSATELPPSLRTFKYADGWDPDRLEEELQSHPFFMTKFPEPGEEVPPLLDAFQQLKYSELENTAHELALNHKEDGLFHFKIAKYRIAATCFSTAISHEMRCPSEEKDDTLIAQMYNNRAACMWYIQNYRSCIGDCEKAVGIDPRYVKAIKRGCLACEKLRKWDQLDKFVGLAQDLAEENVVAGMVEFVADMRKAARKGRATDALSSRREAFKQDAACEERERVMAEVRARQIRMVNEGFLEGEAARDGKTVTLQIVDGGTPTLFWPVLFMYPQYSQSDFVEQLSENDTFEPHLFQMLDADPPGWDAEGEYRVANVEVYHINNGFVRVDIGTTLKEVMSSDKFALPRNGVPSFFVLAKGNAFCDVFKQRVDMEG